MLRAANLGEQADTTAAVVGQIAGALYGAGSIPDNGLDRPTWHQRIERMAGDLFDAGLIGLAV